MCEPIQNKTLLPEQVPPLCPHDDYCPECGQGVKRCKRCGRVISTPYIPYKSYWPYRPYDWPYEITWATNTACVYYPCNNYYSY